MPQWAYTVPLPPWFDADERNGIRAALAVDGEYEIHRRVSASDVFVYTSNFDRTKRSAASAVRAFLQLDDKHMDGNEKVEMRVVDGEVDHINVYPHIPDLRRRMQSIIADPRHESGIQRAEMAMAPLRMSLQAYIPAFSMFITQFSWINAADHFTCRQVRSGGSKYAVDPLSLFEVADSDGNGEIDPEELRVVLDGVCEPPIGDVDMKRMHASISNGKGTITFEEFAEYVRKPLPNIPKADMKNISDTARECIASINDGIDPEYHGGFSNEDAVGATMAHLCRRFRAWYIDDTILHYCIGKLAGIISNDFSAECDEQTHPMFTFHSGHDVTVAPFLSVLKSNGWDPSSGDVWPGYASAVLVELLEDTSSGERYVQASSFSGFHLGATDGDVAFAPVKMDGEVDIGGSAVVPLKQFCAKMDALSASRECT